MFSDNLFKANQLFNLINSILIKLHIYFIHFPLKNKFVSSANKIRLISFDTLQMSFMYNKNNCGPSTDPCGTPQTVCNIPDVVISKFTYCFRPVK